MFSMFATKKRHFLSKIYYKKEVKERYVVDGWILIDYFSKLDRYKSSKITQSKLALNVIKEFCYLVGFPKILQMVNGLEYNNNLKDEFLYE